MKIEIIVNDMGVEQVVITNDDGTFLSMPKTQWDELEAQREQSGTLTNQGGIN